jgi:protoporphyrinogen oxidase
MQRVKYLIIGTGPAGLGAAYRLNELGENDFLGVDKENYPGGLATSFLDDAGFTWDIGGHVQFSHYQYFDRVMDEALGSYGWNYHERASYVWLCNRFVPYPFQLNIGLLPEKELWSSFRGLIHEALPERKGEAPQNFREWILQSFGSGIANVFMLPYNEKVWAHPPEMMAYQWIGDRVAKINLAAVTQSIASKKENVNWGPNNRFRFPKFGGTGAIWRAVFAKLPTSKFRLNSSLLSVDPNERIATFAGGEKVKYDYLLSTLPLRELVKIVIGLPERIVDRAVKLRYSTTHVVGIGVKGKVPPKLSDKCWMYFPEESFPFYRMTHFSHYSDSHTPDPRKFYSLMCETAESEFCPVDRAFLVKNTEESLRSAGFINANDESVSRWHYETLYGYPTPSLERDAILREVVPYLDSFNIYSRGRFGGWKYEVSNQDHTFMQGVEWVNFVRDGVREKTYSAISSKDPNSELR